MKRYYQCRLKKGTTTTTGWIGARGAKLNAKVQLHPDKEFWTVQSVYPVSIPEDQLKETQRQRRGGLPSIEKVDR